MLEDALVDQDRHGFVAHAVQGSNDGFGVLAGRWVDFNVVQEDDLAIGAVDADD
jgi:hypothetical protein